MTVKHNGHDYGLVISFILYIYIYIILIPCIIQSPRENISHFSIVALQLAFAVRSGQLRF